MLLKNADCSRFLIIEKGPKMLYLNTSIRGYPKGLRAGADPRKPLLIIPEDFDSLQFQGVPYPLESIEVHRSGNHRIFLDYECALMSSNIELLQP